MTVISTENITDDQIQNLQDMLICERASVNRRLDKLNSQIIDCELALFEYIGDARARCAELLNARTKGA